MKKAPEHYRVKSNHPLASDSSYGNNGFFLVPHPKIIDYMFQCQISDGMGWEHVSVSIIKNVKKVGKAYKNLYGVVGNKGGVQQHRRIDEVMEAVERCPTWSEMCFIKELFWNDDEPAMQLHPPKEDYVSTHPYCLHLWRPTIAALPMPLPEFVGIKGDNVQSF